MARAYCVDLCIDRLKATQGKIRAVLINSGQANACTGSRGKIGKIFKSNNNSVLFSACDTFRAAAIDQLEKWAEKVQATIIKSTPGSDPASLTKLKIILNTQKKI